MPIYTNTEPAAGSVLSVSQGLLLGNTQYVKAMVGTDHNFTGTNPNANDGYHNIIHLTPQSTPTALATIGQLYQKSVSGDNQLFYLSSGNIETQLTGTLAPLAAVTGHVYLPGGILMQWGTFPLPNQPGLNPIVFGVPFPTTLFSIFTTGIQISATSANSVNVRSPSLTGCTIVNSSSGSVTSCYVLAIGN